MTEAGEADIDGLFRALALSQRFHLYWVRSDSPMAGERLAARISSELPAARASAVEVVRLDPARSRELEALSPVTLAEQVLQPLLNPTAGHARHGVIHVVDASRARPEEADAWGQLFARWNERRNDETT